MYGIEKDVASGEFSVDLLILLPNCRKVFQYVLSLIFIEF